MSIAVIAVAILVVVLVVWQTIQIQAIRKKVDAVPQDGNTVATLRSLDERMNHNTQTLSAVAARLDTTEAKLPHAISRIGVVAYDAFGNIAGHQSRTIALMNDSGDGLVVSLLAAREETMFFTKEVRGGHGVQELSPEEQAAVDRAMAR
ncbi:MAG: DUF4446 family protein [Acidimicrobiia bacterium]